MTTDIILLGAKRLVCERAWQLGARPLVVQHPGHSDDWVNRQAERVLLVDYEDPAFIPMLAAAHAQVGFASAVTIAEDALLPCARVNQALGLPGVPPEIVARTRDKAAMRRALEAGGFSPVQWAALETRDQAAAFAARSGYPFILKPVDGVASQGVRMIRSAAELDEMPDDAGAWLAEEYLDGTEYSVECFSFGGRHIVLGINEKANNPTQRGSEFVEATHTVPAPLTEQGVREIKEFARSFLDVIGLQDGPSHTELKWTSRGLRVIETHTRIGGDRLWELLRLTTGLDPMDMTLQWAMGALPPLAEDPEPRGAAVIQFLMPPPGRLTRIHGVQALKRLPGVVDIAVMAELGASIRPPVRSEDRTGFVIAHGETVTQAREICQEVSRRLVLETR